jgi:hypothetical protein
MWSSEQEDTGLTSVQEDSWKTIPLDDGMNLDSYVLTRLQEFMDYQIRMISYNEVGSSPYSTIATDRTRESSKFDSSNSDSLSSYFVVSFKYVLDSKVRQHTLSHSIPIMCRMSVVCDVRQPLHTYNNNPHKNPGATMTHLKVKWQ